MISSENLTNFFFCRLKFLIIINNKMSHQHIFILFIRFDLDFCLALGFCFHSVELSNSQFSVAVLCPLRSLKISREKNLMVKCDTVVDQLRLRINHLSGFSNINNVTQTNKPTKTITQIIAWFIYSVLPMVSYFAVLRDVTHWNWISCWSMYKDWCF